MINHRGFTLIELLLALAISAIISVGTFFLFNTSMNAKDVVEEQSTSFGQLNRVVRVIEQDFIQWTPLRGVRTPYGEYDSALVLNFEGLYLTRNGWASSALLSYERSSLQRVHYRLAEPGSELCPWLDNDEENDAGGCLIRSYKTHLDDDGSQDWHHQMLLRPVKSVDWQFLIFDPALNAMDYYSEPPREDPRDGIQRTRLRAVLMKITTGQGSEIERLFRTPSQPPVVEESLT